MLTSYKRRLCPDEEKLKDLKWALRNEYYSPNRINFSIDVIKCTTGYSKVNCSSDEKIKTMLDSLYFKVHTVVDRIEF